MCTQLVDVEEDVEEEVNGLVTYDRRFVTADEGVVRAINDRLRAAAAASDD